MKEVDVALLRAWMSDHNELALLDAREEGEFGAGHLFAAVCCQLSRVELKVPVLLPNLNARVVCMDGGSGSLAMRLAKFLDRSGYTNVHVLIGGLDAWMDAGGLVFTGVNVPSKAFGEWVEERFETESVPAEQVKAWLDSGANIAVVDSRPFEEYRRMSIPTGLNVPGAELVYRIGDLVPDPETIIVVNCAGRTRSIMGAESLRRAGIPNQVVALRNGTMGWELAGFECERGAERRFPKGTPRSASEARQRAKRFAAEAGVISIDAAGLAAFRADPTRTLYVLDVRDPIEFQERCAVGTVSAPGGQLLQQTDEWIAVPQARIVLVDDADSRALMVGGWLRLKGHREIYVIDDGIAALPAGAPADARTLPLVALISPPELAQRLDDPGLVVLDVGLSLSFRSRHVQGALWGVRTRLGQRVAEPLRVCRRLQLLRRWSHHEQDDEQVFPGSAPASRAAGGGSRT